MAHRGFFNRLQNGRPRVTLKLATSFDGRIATASGESQWITGAEARRDVHGLRACHDAVMVGGGTARADNPSLTVRGLNLDRQPVRVVVSRHLDFDAPALQASRDVAPLWLCHAPQVRENDALANSVRCALAGSACTGWAAGFGSADAGFGVKRVDIGAL